MRCSFLLTLLTYLTCLVSAQLFASEQITSEQMKLAAERGEHAQHVLILHSYAPSYEWTADIQQGINTAFKHSDALIAPSIEYLDSKRIHEKSYYESFKLFLKLKYENYHFDGIIVSDDRALSFIKSFDGELLKNVPIVAIGINNKNAYLTSLSEAGHIVYEEDNILDNIKLIIKIRPNIKKLYLLSDNSMTSSIVRGEIKAHIRQFRNIELIELTAETLEQAQKVLMHASESDAVLLTHFNSELESGVFHSYDKIARKISRSSSAPVFVLWRHNIKGDILGGRVQDPYSLGIYAVKLLGKELPLLLSPSLPDSKPYQDLFNYDALNKFNISKFMLPKNAEIVNEPTSFVEANLRILFISGSIITILVVIIAMQSVSIRQKRELAKKNRKIYELQDKTLNVQKDMIYILGEAIESRSGETGNHVKRVASLSSKLAQLYGLDKSECDLIEVISPMHDVGKIAIPEAILDKPGKLTEQEWQVMKTHTISGFNLLNSSEGDVMALAAVVALEHHEHWDGNGYPNGKKGKDIHIYARITAIADVFDALLSQRCYKSAWHASDVKELFIEKCGKQFDPEICMLLIENIEEFIELRRYHPDNVVPLEYAI
ncbi:HD domain-containing phosphohydrolase [Vibrio penaeicida]|uniref:HD domain-containing phosphohydrolase n=1 Tax=Vibrio penaeicida TaxID=104609 RepID=UPI001F386F1E|nr:HD domain-containing phosphohydrolase [Vibrio penaeicida]